MVIGSMKRGQVRIGVWLVLGAAGLLGAARAAARQVIDVPAEEVIAKGQVVAIAVIEKFEEKKGQCEDLREYLLRPELALKGKLTPEMKQVPHSQADLKGGQGCMEVSYSRPPWATAREVGAKVIVVINYVESWKQYRATASFNIEELTRIKKLTGTPAPDCQDGFGANCAYDPAVPGAAKLGGGIQLPPEAEQVCFAIDEFSGCQETKHTYRVRKGKALIKVSEEEFKRALAEKNKACGNCLRTLQYGPG
jgi:hypothetical protein